MNRARCCFSLLLAIALFVGMVGTFAPLVFAQVVSPARPDLSEQTRARIEDAASESTLAPWQREFMRDLARGDGPGVGSPSAGTPSSLDGEWLELATLRGRTETSAVYDPVRDRMVVFGGADSTHALSDAWALTLDDSPAWTPVGSGTPPSRPSSLPRPLRGTSCASFSWLSSRSGQTLCGANPSLLRSTPGSFIPRIRK